MLRSYRIFLAACAPNKSGATWARFREIGMIRTVARTLVNLFNSFPVAIPAPFQSRTPTQKENVLRGVNASSF